MPTWYRKNNVIFKIFFRFNKYSLKFIKHYQKVHFSRYVYTFFYEQIFKNEGNSALLLECPFFYITRGGRNIIGTVYSKLKKKYCATIFVAKSLNKRFDLISIFTIMKTILRKSIFRSELILFFFLNK